MLLSPVRPRIADGCIVTRQSASVTPVSPFDHGVGHRGCHFHADVRDTTPRRARLGWIAQLVADPDRRIFTFGAAATLVAARSEGLGETTWSLGGDWRKAV